VLLVLKIKNSKNMSIETRPQFNEVKYPGKPGILPRWTAHRGALGGGRLGEVLE